MRGGKGGLPKTVRGGGQTANYSGFLGAKMKEIQLDEGKQQIRKLMFSLIMHPTL